METSAEPAPGECLHSRGAAGNFKAVAFEIRAADGTTTRITAADKPPADDDNEARDASTVAKKRIEQMRASKTGEGA